MKIRSRFNFFLICSLFLITACTHEYIPDFEITSPKSGWTYYDDSSIIFSSDLNSENLVWSSSIDGELGKGPSLCSKLSKGNHTITLEYENSGNSKTVDIVVKEKEASAKVQLLQTSGESFNHPDKSYCAGIFSIDGSTESQSIKTEKSTNQDICCRMTDSVIHFSSENSPIQMDFSRAAETQAAPSNRTFNVMNTITQLEAHEIQAELIETTENLYVYADSSISEEKRQQILDCVSRFEKTAYSRVIEIWGTCLDLNQDGKFTLLFTPVINDEGVAIGFFNQNDFFAEDEDISSSSYNPFTNQMDICYVAVPDESNSNYCFDSIIATVAHELTHAVNFSKKTYSRLLNGQSNADVMEVYLDEGLSHLTESLIGYGESGGNLKFVERYLKHTAEYSFCSTDIYDRSDSVSQRGAMTLFLYYLFQKNGGMEWKEDGSVVDKGGISFLRNIISAEACDWTAIGQAMNTDTDLLYKEFCLDLFHRKLSDIFDFTITDPVTAEKIFYCPEMTTVDAASITKILPYSIMKFADDITAFTLEWKTLSGNIYAVY